MLLLGIGLGLGLTDVTRLNFSEVVRAAAFFSKGKSARDTRHKVRSSARRISP